MSGSGDSMQNRRSRILEGLRRGAETVYFDTLESFKEQSRVLDRAIRYKADSAAFRTELEAWFEGLADLKYAEKEWTRCLSGSELQEVLRGIQQEMGRFDTLRKDACTYIDSLLGPDGSAASDAGASAISMEREVRKLGAQVQGLTATLSKTRIDPAFNPQSQRTPPLDPSAPAFVPRTAASDSALQQSATRVSLPQPPVQSTNESGETLVRHLTAALTSLNNKERLPKIEPTVFKGDLLEFPMWWSSFELLIESQDLSDRQKLLYLNQYLSEDVKRSIKWLLQLTNREDSFELAKSELFETYGDHMKIADEYRKKLRNWPQIRRNDAAGLKRYGDFLYQCLAAKESLGYLEVLEQAEENRKLASKLPSNLAERWNRIVVKQLRAEGRASADNYKNYPSFESFCEYVRDEAWIADGPCVPEQRPAPPEQRPVTRQDDRSRRPARSFATGVRPQGHSHQTPRGAAPRQPNLGHSRPQLLGQSQPREQAPTGSVSVPRPPKPRPPMPPPPCPPGKCRFCSKDHELTECVEFLSQPGKDKKDFALQNNLCFGCLGEGHCYTECIRKNNSLLKTRDPSKIDVQSMNTRLKHAGSSSFYAMTVPVCISYAGRYVYTYALVDTQSNNCFLDESLRERLRVPGVEVTLELTTMQGTCETQSDACRGIQIRGVTEEECYKLPVCYTRSEIPGDKGAVPKPEDLIGWPHLSDVRECMYEYREDWGIGLLLGCNFAPAFVPKATVVGKDDEPFALRTGLGWSVLGSRSTPDQPSATTINAVSYRTSAREVTMSEVRKAFDGDFLLGPHPDVKVSQDDRKFLEQMEKGLRVDPDGHLSLPLPLKDESRPLPDSYRVAYKRLMALKARFKKDPEFHRQYVEFIMNMLEHGYAEPVPMKDKHKKKLYLPHQGVKHPRKPNVTRVVFDGGSETEGVSLNSLLRSGPDLNNRLLGVLMRFRLKKIGFTCDIEKMFMQVRVWEEHRNMLCFLFFENGDPDGAVVEYRVTVHLFGATSSPAVSTYALRKTAEMFGDEFEPEVAEFIKSNFYVDDGLGSEETNEATEKRMLEARELCAKGGFNLCKFASSSQEVNEKLPEKMMAKDIAAWEVMPSDGPRQVTLGMQWSLALDAWRFTIQPQVKAFTRRGMLSTLSSIYDPLGLISPVLLKGRNILQSLCKEGLGWDEPVKPEIAREWREWHEQLMDLESIKIRRCYRKKVGEEYEVEYHIFGDASGSGYGGCGYILCKDRVTQEVETSLVVAKSRVQPTKEVPMPRLELQAAVTAVNLKESMCLELPFKDVTIYMYTDSSIVLAYLYNELLKLDRFTANRVQFILDRTEKEQWRKVPTEANPADIASRGLSAVELMRSNLWWQGPQMMQNPGGPWCPAPLTVEDPGVQPEKAKVQCFGTVSRHNWSWEEQVSDISEWKKLVVVTAVWHRYVRQMAHKVRNEPSENLPLHMTAPERRSAQLFLVREAQRDYLPKPIAMLRGRDYSEYPEEMRLLKDQMRGYSNLYRLDPFIDQDGVMRVGGRVRRANLPEEVKHPAIIPAGTFVSRLLIRQVHEDIGHAGANHTLGALRSAGWWVLRGKREIARQLRECVACRKLRGPTLTQKMADLPLDRIEEAPPFSYCGVDLIGPIVVKVRRSQEKRWLAMYTCLVIRAVHIEVCEDLTTSAFLQAHRRFIARRGPLKLLRSDRGTNIVGAQNELRRQWDMMDVQQLSKKLAEDGCELEVYQPNTPRAPHMGGAWERLVGSVKRTMSALLMRFPARLDDWQLFTFAAEAEAIVNSRPITYVDSTDTDLPIPLSPIRLLTMKQSHVPAPPGNFPPEDLYGRRRWRQSQHIAEEFWHQWRRDYLPTLQVRRKWLEARDNLKKDDVVLIQEDNVNRSQWPLGRVMSVKESADGLVRSVTVKTKLGTYERPVHKLVMVYRKEGDA